MATSAISTAATSATSNGVTAINPKSILGKDDFMKLLLTELQYQDPTSPMDTGKILTQTSQLATLESADNTNNALKDLTDRMTASSDLGAVSAIGKMGSLGTDKINLRKGNNPSFEMYFSHDVQSGTVTIKDSQNNVVKTLDLNSHVAGVLSFSWDGTDDSGSNLPEGQYSITSDYSDGTNSYQTAYGSYPIESVRFDSGKALLKMGSNYYPLKNVKEIYQ